ncbi:hypothetical protein V8D89_008867 [Ganoderma adspersum]
MSVVLNVSSFSSPDFVIPTWALGEVSEALESTSHWATDRMQEQMVATLLSTIFLGTYTLCVAYAARILIGRGPTGSRRKLLYVTMAMYLATFASWITLVVTQFQTFHTIRHNLSEIYSWIPPSDCFFQDVSDRDLPAYCTTIPAEASHHLVGEWPATSECVGTVSLTFNVVVGDAIVWWRVWVLWNKSCPLLVLGCLVLLATLVSGAIDSVISCSDPLFAAFLGYANGAVQGAPKDGSFFQLSVPGVVVIALSLFSNTVATCLVGYRAWKHRRSTKTHFAGVPSVVRVQRALTLLVESGIAYSLVWAVVLSSQGSGYTPFSYGIQYFTEGCLLALVGIYPTMIIILVALDKSEIERQSHVVSLPMPGIGKTVLLIFFLVQCMSQEEPALFTTRSETTYLFDERGVVMLNLRTSDFSAAEHLLHRVGYAPRPWSLVDRPRERAPPPSSDTLDARPHMFFVTTLSPDKPRYKPYETERSIRTWWMSRRSDEELIAILQRAPPDLRHSTFDADAVRTLRAAAGPSPATSSTT